jgi:hypothetical protein
MDGAGALSFFRAARAGMLQGTVIDSYDDFPSVRIMPASVRIMLLTVPIMLAKGYR